CPYCAATFCSTATDAAVTSTPMPSPASTVIFAFMRVPCVVSAHEKNLQILRQKVEQFAEHGGAKDMPLPRVDVRHEPIRRAVDAVHLLDKRVDRLDTVTRRQRIGIADQHQ